MKVANGVWGAANFKRYYHQILTLASQPDLPARRLIAGETFTPSGNWSTYPPHKHQVENFTIRDNNLHMMLRGYHTVVSAPGYTTYYLWFLAGDQHVQGAIDDPQLGWVMRTVAMLKELGH